MAAMCILAGACQKEPEPEEDDRTHVEAVDDGWGSGGETGVYPDRGDRIRVNAGLSSLPSGAEVSGDGFSLHLSHHAADFVLAVESGEALELVPADALSPDGYELPSMEDFNKIFDGTGTVWMAWNGSYEIREPWNGAGTKDTRILRFRKSDVEYIY